MAQGCRVGAPVQEADAVSDGGGPRHDGEVGVEGLQVHLQRPQGLQGVLVAVCGGQQGWLVLLRRPSHGTVARNPFSVSLCPSAGPEP